MSKAKKVNQQKNHQDSSIGTEETYELRNVGIQTAQQTKDYISPQMVSHHNLEKYDYNSIFYTPRTVSSMVFALFVLNYFAYTLVPLNDASDINADQPKDGFKYTSKMQVLLISKAYSGIIAGIFSFLAFCSTQYPDTLIKRPHPVFWRVLLGLMSIYNLFMVYLLFQPLNEGRKVFKFFDPKLGEKLPEKSYAADCRIFTPENPNSSMFNVYDATFDVHFIAHLFGWWFKMMIIRDVKMCWICSIVFELLEITFRHWLPNFWECWWDHLLLDLFGCNALGIVLGAYTCNYLYVGRLHWIYTKNSITQQNPCESKVKVFFEKFKPNVWAKYDWGFFSSPQRYLSVLFYCFFVLAVDCNNFFLKFIIWIPPEHKILQVRLAIWAFSAIAATKEYYEYVSNPYCKRVSPFLWLTCFTLLIEFSIIIKFGTQMFTAPFPWYVKLMWSVIGFFVLCGYIYAYKNDIKNNSKDKKEKDARKYQLNDPVIEIENISKKNQ
ncbi:phosphatidylserine synthase 2 [Stylonychia lemnae]|uniref:Phosphatidylserine synthase 2 n=1 Tax=Stylonychia lemnae TaxID=5949 RepID=A0A078A9I8_STYLE|nr:phosphatidylserine synthase 2 [Stylonychia lemnae]|eukprot:CDW78531.1 phosphatidylserine synthase 2 [Stylonychia lemnae]